MMVVASSSARRMYAVAQLQEQILSVYEHFCEQHEISVANMGPSSQKTNNPSFGLRSEQQVTAEQILSAGKAATEVFG